MTVIDPRNYLVDINARPFFKEFCVDLTAPDAPLQSEGRFLVANVKIPKNQRWVVKSIMPYAMARTDVGLVTESVRMLSNIEAGGYFSFEPTVNGHSPFVLDKSYTTFQIAGPPAPTATQSAGASGISHISDNPWFQANATFSNPLFSFEISPDSNFTLIFSLLKLGSTFPIPNPYQIPAVGTNPPKRIDFAGAVIAGVFLPDQAYQTVLKEVESQGVGPA